MSQVRRWRGTIDVPLSVRGIVHSWEKLRGLNLDLVYHDHLSRCRDTANMICANVFVEDEGPRPWKMGSLFEGREIDEDSLQMARWYIKENIDAVPPGGEKFRRWIEDWMFWIKFLEIGHSAVGIVTHNRNIQYLYSIFNGRFEYKLYDCRGPDFNSVHYYDRHTGSIAPWGRNDIPKGIYLIRHGETEWGT